MTTLPPTIPINDLKRRFQPLQAELEAAMRRVIAGGSFILGDACAGFEAEFARYCGVAQCVGVANGTDAMELALRALEIGPGARVATVANAGMYATAAILAVGALPVFVDVDPTTLTMSPRAIAAAGSLDAAIVTHLYGRMADMKAIAPALKGVPIVEDCAQAHGAMLDGRRAGAWGDIGCFSFYPTKNLGALGDGGAVTTDDARLADRVRKLRRYGWTERYRAELPGGRNSRLDEIQAAALSVMLPHVDAWNEKRRAIVATYAAAVRSNTLTPPPTPRVPDYVAHLCVMRSTERDRMRSMLSALGIATDIHYPIPDYRQAAVETVLGQGVALPETERANAEILTLPCFPEMTAEEVDRVANALADCPE